MLNAEEPKLSLEKDVRCINISILARSYRGFLYWFVHGHTGLLRRHPVSVQLYNILAANLSTFADVPS